jgi:carboxypeptidase PM20D1
MRSIRSRYAQGRILLRLLLLTIVVLAIVVVANALMQRPLQPQVPAASPLPIDPPAAARRLAKVITMPTVSYEDPGRLDRAAFERLHAFLTDHYPRVREQLDRYVIADLSLLYTWPGSDPDLPAVMLTAHQDVVPADASDWTQPPFEGVIEDGYIWGRGAMDDKVGVLGILEATEYLLGIGFQPRRTIYFAFGHDEELDGTGAAAIAAELQAQGARIDFVLDEGMMIVEGIVPGLDAPAALIGLAEKGYANVTLSVETTGGHASVPPHETAVGILAKALTRLQANPMRARFEGPVQDMFRWLSPEMSLGPRIVLGNLWLFGPLVRAELTRSPETNAAIRTTAAPTMLSASDAPNVLARQASAVINCRILPGDSIEGTLEHVRRVVDDPRVQVVLGPGEANGPTPVSPVDADAFEHIAASVRAVFPDAVVAPSLVIPATDARHYGALTDKVYRLLPISVTAEDVARFHGIDERISVQGYADVISFYAEVMRRAASSVPQQKGVGDK